MLRYIYIECTCAKALYCIYTDLAMATSTSGKTKLDIAINFKPNEQTVLYIIIYIYILHCFTHMHAVQIATTLHWLLRFFRNHTTHTASILYHQSTSIYTQVPTTHKCLNVYNFVQS